MSELTLLKSGVSYLIFRERYKDGLVIRKFANSDNEKLLKEINRILDLRASYPTMHRRLPEIIDSGLVDEGIQAGRRYYRQRYVQGKTFSSLLARQPEAIENANIVANIENGLCACIAEMEPTRLSPAEYETRQKQWLKAELDRIAEQPLTGPLAHQDEIEIDGQTYRGLVASLGDLLDNEWKFGPADVGWSNLGHWNFHGDNILVADISRPNDFSIIDPDSGIDTADPVFSACRFLYSYPHDTAEYGKYTIQTHAYRRPGRPSFGISLLWTDSSIGLYEPLFERWQDSLPRALADAGMSASIEPLRRRIAINLLICLLRGVNANHTDKIEFVEDDLTALRNPAIFLLLFATKFAKRALPELGVKATH